MSICIFQILYVSIAAYYKVYWLHRRSFG